MISKHFKSSVFISVLAGSCETFIRLKKKNKKKNKKKKQRSEEFLPDERILNYIASCSKFNRRYKGLLL